MSMLRCFGIIGHNLDQKWAWLSRGHRWTPGVRDPLKSSVTGPSLLVNRYLQIKFHKKIRVNPPLTLYPRPPPLPPSFNTLSSLSADPTDLSRDGESYVGKVRSNLVGTKFTIYGSGLNPVKPPKPGPEGAVIYREVGHV